MQSHIILKPGKLTEARLRAGMTQKILADALGMSRAFVAALELGERSPSAVSAKKITRILKCEFDDLFEIRRS